MPSKKKQSALINKGFAKRDERGKLVIAKNGFFRILTHHGITSEFRGKAAKRLSKYPQKQRIKWYGDPYYIGRYVPIYAFLLKKFSKTGLKGKKILELGFGATTFMEELASQGAKVYGLDIHSVEKKPGIKIEVGRAEELNKHFRNQKFDAIYSCGLFHPGGGVKPIDDLQHAVWDINSEKAAGRSVKGAVEKLKKIRAETVAVLKKVNAKLNKGGYFILYGERMLFQPNVFEQAGFRYLMRPKPFSETLTLRVLIKK